jgi:CubicO group peptidase (beta-lactamase class C family)
VRIRVREVVAIAIVASVIWPTAASAGEEVPAAFQHDIETARAALGIPGLSVAVVANGEIVFTGGLGYADLDAEIEAAPDTPYGLASVTKPLAAVLVMQLVEEGAIDLDLPTADYGVRIPGASGVTVRHLLTHTSEGVPGRVHRYNGNRYGLLGGVIEGATGRSFATEMSERILVPLDLTDTALNPLSGWDGASLAGLDELRLTLGMSPFGAYPDVYRRLATPYQFDEDHTIVPGMYHLNHSPAAGGISSVADLAAFDIALDAGELLGEAAMGEMLTAAYPVPGGHQGCAYGLGWYVQDFDGMRIEWHTGRWPPSTSALYARFPDQGMTLIVLANTDNLTVPFYGLGNGDVMHSVMSLLFYRHFIYPEVHGSGMPALDWAGSAVEMTSQVAGEVDPVARGFLERELWAFRQAYWSSGNTSQADAIGAVLSDVFRGSRHRTDPFFTAVAGEPALVSPILAARSLITISWVSIVWIALMALSVLAMSISLAIARERSLWMWGIWILASLFLGPIGPVLWRLTAAPDPPAPRWSSTLASAVASSVGYSTAWLVAIAFIIEMGDEANPAIVLAGFGLPLIVGLFAVRAPWVAKAGGGRYASALRKGLVGELISFHIGVGVLFAVTLYVDNRILATVPYPISPFFWPMIALITAVSTSALWLIHYWIARRGLTVWFTDPGPSSRLPRWADSWWMVGASFVTMVLLIGGTAAVFG